MFPNKTGYLNIHVFIMITGKTESKMLRKDIWCKCKKHHVCEWDYISSSDSCSCENG